MLVGFNAEPDQMEIAPRHDGLVNVFLRKSIEKTEEGWQAEEVHFVGRYSSEDVRENFETYWQRAKKAEMSPTARMFDIEELQAEQDAAICELYELMIGEE